MKCLCSVNELYKIASLSNTVASIFPDYMKIPAKTCVTLAINTDYISPSHSLRLVSNVSLT